MFPSGESPKLRIRFMEFAIKFTLNNQMFLKQADIIFSYL